MDSCEVYDNATAGPFSNTRNPGIRDLSPECERWYCEVNEWKQKVC